MSTNKDAASIVVADNPALALNQLPSTVTITDAMTSPVVTLTVPTAVQTIQVNTPGPQGLQNVYVQSNDPAVEFGWGPAQAGFIWLEIP